MDSGPLKELQPLFFMMTSALRRLTRTENSKKNDEGALVQSDYKKRIRVAAFQT